MRFVTSVIAVLLVSSLAVVAAEIEPDFPTLRSLDRLQDSFNEEQGKVRLVALLSPSCGYCVKGYRYLQKLLDEIDDPRLAMSIIWLPMLSGDSQALAEKLGRRNEDLRLGFQAWDPDRKSGEAWKQRLGLGSTAWDVYFLYEADDRWDGSLPPEPAYWQHQGAGGRDNWLDYQALKERILQALSRAEGQVAQ